MTYDVLIIGSGLAGSSMASALAQSGWKVLLVERQRQAQHKVCGEFLSPESQASLQALGLYQQVAALQPIPIPLAILTSMRGTPLSLPLQGQAWGISRYALDEALLQAAEAYGVELMRGATATALEVTADMSNATIRTQQQEMTVSARLSILACGRNPLAGLRTPEEHQSADRHTTRSHDYVGVKCHYTGISMPSQCELFLFQGGYLGVSPVETGAVNVCMLISKEAFRRAGASVLSAIQYASQASPALARRLAEGVPLSESASAVAAIDTHRRAQPWGPTARLGDTVTMIPPLCGDGMAMALRSAQLAAPLVSAVLRRQLSFEEWARVHSQSWLREFSSRIHTGRLLQTMLSYPRLADTLLSLGQHIPPITGQLVAMTRG